MFKYASKCFTLIFYNNLNAFIVFLICGKVKIDENRDFY